jgi:hypothetical protein
MKGGHWVNLERAWHDTEVTNCDVCGRLIPRRSWVFAGANGEEINSCDTGCEELYETYVVGRTASDANN